MVNAKFLCITPSTLISIVFCRLLQKLFKKKNELHLSKIVGKIVAIIQESGQVKLI